MNSKQSIKLRTKIRIYQLMPDLFTDAWERLTAPNKQKKILEKKIASLPQWSRGEMPGEKSMVRIGFIGAGNYARNHLNVLSHLHNVKIASILTTGNQRVQEVAQKYDIDRVFSDENAFFDYNDVDCYFIVASAYKVKDIALNCLSTKKPVLLEKPAGMSAAETAELVEKADNNATYGMVCMNRRFYSVIEHGLAALAEYGPIRGVLLEIPEAITQDRKSGRLTEIEYDRFMFRNSVHGIDLLRYILGDVVDVKSISKSNKEMKFAGASFGAILEHEGGALSTVLALWDTPRIWRLRVIAEHAWLEFGDLEQGWFVHESEPESRIPLPCDPVDVQFRPGVYAQDLHFLEAVRRHEQPFLPACLLPDAHKTNQLIEQIYESFVPAQ